MQNAAENMENFHQQNYIIAKRLRYLNYLCLTDLRKRTGFQI